MRDLPLSWIASLFCLTNWDRALAQSLFSNHADIGNPAKTGSYLFDHSNRWFVVSGSGENMWFTNDAFHFAWTKMSGDIALSAAIEWVGATGNPHRKACLMIRQSLSADSPYVDVAVHGNGLTSLQFREAVGGPTREIQATQIRPERAGIEREGDVFLATLPRSDGATRDGSESKGSATLEPCGAFIRLPMTDPVYVGLAVCSHDDKVTEEARFLHLELQKQQPDPLANRALHCALETVSVSSKDRRLVYHTLDHIEAPNWSRDGRYLLFNSAGRIYRLPVEGSKLERIETGFAGRCNNDHGLSPDGTHLVVSDQSRGGKSLIYTLPISGGTPHLVTQLGPSYWHGWSPDGLTLVYCAERDGEFDVYSIPTEGGEEKRLTTAKGLDDGPDYSADGQHIYFNSERTGTMQIWRMKPDGSQQEQVTSDEFNNWFPHPSPDGKWLVFLSYDKGVAGHPADQPVRLRLMPMGGGPIQDLARLFGGQGTINVPSWSPDSRQVAFVSYEFIRKR